MTDQHNDTPEQSDILNDETLDAALQAALYRQDCPDTMELGEYQLGLLPEDHLNQIKTHLNRCPHCQEELTHLTDFITEEIADVTETPQLSTTTWIEAGEFAWRQIGEAGPVIVRLLAEKLIPSTPQFVLGQRGETPTEKANVIRQIRLGPDETGDLDLEATIYQHSDEPDLCTLIVRAEIPSRWPTLTGVQIQATAGDWQAEGVTNEEGVVTLEDLPADLLPNLVIKIEL